MSQAILIVTWAGTTGYCQNLLETLLPQTSIPVVVAINEIENCDDQEFLTYLREHSEISVLPIIGNRWECGGIQAMIACTPYDEFILIQDTLEVKDARIFRAMFEVHPKRSVAYGPSWDSYLAKYRRQVLMQMNVPVCLTKLDAFYNEIMFNNLYSVVATHVEGREPYIMFPEWGNDNPNNWYEEKFGRKNIVLANPYLIKRKSLEWAGLGAYSASILHNFTALSSNG